MGGNNLPGWALEVAAGLQIMQPKNAPGAAVQRKLERRGTILAKSVRPQQPLVRLARSLDWPRFAALFAPPFHPANGRPGLPTRLLVGLQYLKYAYGQADEAVLADWRENPYRLLWWRVFRTRTAEG